MAPLYIRFAQDLTDYAESSALVYHGPLFHRWLPDGQSDSLPLSTGHPDLELTVWFERRGFTSDGFIEFDFKRREVDPAIMERQGILDAGPLRGILTLRRPPQAAILAIQGDLRGDEQYIAIAKFVIQDVLFPALDRFMALLRVHFGQFWISNLEAWDSRSLTLGAYCGRLNMEWALDPAGPWTDFVPNDPIHMAQMVVISASDPYLEYITTDDWRGIPRLLEDMPQPSTSALLMRRSHELLAHGRTRYALVEGCSALELAIEDFVRAHQDGSPALQELAKSFFALSLASRMAILTSSLDRLPKATIEAAARAIDERNRLVHEGREPSPEAPMVLKSLLLVTASLLPGCPYRFPEPHHQNSLAEPSKWEELYRQSTS